VAARIRTAKLIIVPHGVLHYVPFCALGSADAPLLDRYDLRILPSATVLAFLKPAKPIESALILGNPDLDNPALDLPFAQEEGHRRAASRRPLRHHPPGRPRFFR